MKKRVLCIMAMLCVAMCMSAQDLYERKWNVVHVDRPGNLIPCIFETIHARADNLEIHGEINGSDLLMLNLIMGGSSGIGGYDMDFPGYRKWESTKFYLCPREIDLSDARIVPGDWYIYMYLGFDDVAPTWLYTEKDTIGHELFLDVDSLKRLVLPEGTKKVRHNLFCNLFASNSCYLEELVVPASVEYFSADQWDVRRIVFKGTEPPVSTMFKYGLVDDGAPIDCDDEVDLITDEQIENAQKWEVLKHTTLVVPKGCREKYMQKGLWRYAKEIIEEGELTDVKAAEADGAACAPQADDRTFRLDGRLARESDKGVVVRGGRKVLR